MAASGRKWPLGVSRTSAGSHLQPLAALAATCSHLQPLEWPQVAASGRKWPLGGRKWPLGVSRTTAWQPLAASRVAASGRKWPLGVSRTTAWQPLAATCSHSSPQVAASGCEWPQAAVGASGCKCPQVAAWIANPCPEGHVPQNLKKINFPANRIFFKFALQHLKEGSNAKGGQR